jgi:hypothetical protein
MSIIPVFICACLFLTVMTSSAYDGDWSSGGHVASPVVSHGYGVPYPVYYDYANFDPWYRGVALPFLNDWYWPPSYYPGYYHSYYGYPHDPYPYYHGVEMRPAEARAEWLFNHGIGEPWVGGDPPYSH